jgi:hypothetical protein
MVLVTMTCSHCGPVEVSLDRVVLSVDDTTAAARCIMRCPGCLGRMERAACDAMAVAMVMVGAVVTPGGSGSGDRPGSLPPLTAADAERFRLDLEAAQPEELVPGL